MKEDVCVLLESGDKFKNMLQDMVKGTNDRCLLEQSKIVENVNGFWKNFVVPLTGAKGELELGKIEPPTTCSLKKK